MYEPLYPSGSNRMMIKDVPINEPSLQNDIQNPDNNTVPGLDGTPCADLFPECPDFKENKYCVKYRKQMLFQCRKSCGFCAINPFEDIETSGMSEDDQDESSGDEENSGLEKLEAEYTEDDKRSLIPQVSSVNIENYDDLLIEDEKRFDRLKSRFTMPGLVPSLEDLYAELGTLHPSLDVKMIQSKSNQDKRSKVLESKDPFKYLRNKIAGASIQPIVDVNSLSSTRVQRSNPVYVVKNPKAVIA
ncbi:hypothetical protein MXB_1361, partial [Myxobolus squamalis]